jgi:hypothetical protein
LASDRHDDSYKDSIERGRSVRRILGLSAVAAISAFAGGLAVTLWHRKTLEKLQNPILLGETDISEFTDSEIERVDVDGF